jgi:DNA invertase Pin-like site-specific DNA recombinase
MSESRGSTTLPLRQGAEPATRVAVYSRYSTDRQDARSIDDQVRRCRQFAVARGYEIVDEYADAAISGAHTERQNLSAC